MGQYSQEHNYDLIIIGAGAAGMMCAAKAGQAGCSVLLIDHAKRIGEKIRISGGGRCNFTNRHLDGYDASPYYLSDNPRFVRYALSNYTANDFIALLERHEVAYHEKHKGQLFCDHSATEIIALLQRECEVGKVHWRIECTIDAIVDQQDHFRIESNQGTFHAPQLVIATGGLAIPKIGASDFGYRIAKQFGHSIIRTRPALVPLQFENWDTDQFQRLAGIALPVLIRTQLGKRWIEFEEDLLFRHRGLSGPAALQISSYVEIGGVIEINLAPNIDLSTALTTQKEGKRIQLDTALSTLVPTLPRRLIDHWLAQPPFHHYQKHPWADIPNRLLIALGESLNQWQLSPSGTEGHRIAEATRGGVNTREINPRTMESNLRPNLYFIGEVVDVVGWLGGYNFGWAWASAICAARAIASAT